MKSHDLGRSLALLTLLSLAAPAGLAQQDTEKTPVPDAAAQKEARQLIAEVYADDFAAAKTPTQ